MRALISIFSVRFALSLQYRMAAIAGFFTQVFFGFVMVMVFDAFFSSTDKVMPMSFAQTVTYIWLGQGFLGMLPWNGDREVQLMIRNGDFAYEMIRPINIYDYWYFKILAQRIAGTILRAVPLFLITALIIPEPYNIGGPASLSAFLFFAFSLIGACLLGGAISNLITISVLFTIGDGLDRLFPALVMVFSGMIIPLSFFPDWTQPFLKMLPFSGLVDKPYLFYLGIYQGHDLFFTLLHQFLWTALFVLSGKWMVLAAGKRTVVQGG